MFINASCCPLALLHSGVVVKLLADSFEHLKVGGSNPLQGYTATMDVYFITLCSCMVYCNTFYYQEMARIYPPSQKPQNAKVSTFWRFPPNAKNSWREPCLLPPKNLKYWGQPWRDIDVYVNLGRAVCYSFFNLWQNSGQLTTNVYESQNAKSPTQFSAICFLFV